MLMQSCISCQSKTQNSECRQRINRPCVTWYRYEFHRHFKWTRCRSNGTYQEKKWLFESHDILISTNYDRSIVSFTEYKKHIRTQHFTLLQRKTKWHYYCYRSQSSKKTNKLQIWTNIHIVLLLTQCYINHRKKNPIFFPFFFLFA